MNPVPTSGLLERARAVMPGGVSSPVRAFGAVPGEPPTIARGAGAYLFDTEGRRYVDLVGSWGPLILGHAHPAVVEAVERRLRDGLSFGATCEGEIELAERVAERFPFVQRVRFVSSGTEAVMSALRLARGVTGRSRILKFEGCYHGHSDGLLVKGGSGQATLGVPSSAGVPAEVVGLTEVLPLDDEHAVEQLFAARGDEIAAVVIEPIPANAGLLVQRRVFLERLRELTQQHGALLVFDEVISGLRVNRGGACTRFGINPDLITLGKVLGGGMPVGAFAGPAAIMEQLAPNGPVYQAGTLSGNPVAMAAGIATLKELDREGIYAQLEQQGAALEQAWTASLKEHSVDASVVRVGSILWLSLQPQPAPRAWHDIDPACAGRYGEMHASMLAAGLWMAPSAYEVAFLSTAHRADEIDAISEAFKRALAGNASPAS